MNLKLSSQTEVFRKSSAIVGTLIHMSQKPNRARILIVEDELDLAQQIQAALVSQGHLVKIETDGNLGLAAIIGAKPDLVLLDIMLPGLDGLTVAQKTIKEYGIPVIFMTARDSSQDRIKGLSLGADDYIVKPFVMAELLLRIGAVLRRVGISSPPIQIGNLIIDEAKGEVTVEGHEVPLTSTEFKIICELARARGRVLSKTYLLSQVWGYDAFDPNLVEVHLSALRKKLTRVDHENLVKTKRGLGYVIAK